MTNTETTKLATKLAARVSPALGRIQALYPQVKKITDATRNITIEVTRSDTTSSKVRNHSECALAHAAKRMTNAEGAIINVTTAYLITGDKAVRYELPTSVSREVVSFDRDAGFDPGSYHLRKPKPSRRLNNPKRSGAKKWVKGNGESPKPYHITGAVRRVGDLNT